MFDSAEKTILLIAKLADVPVVFKDKVHLPKPLFVSEAIYRSYRCPEGCGACCRAHTLDWLESEYEDLKEFGLLDRLVKRPLEVNGEVRFIWSQIQQGPPAPCSWLQGSRCGIHPVRPFSCDYEPIRLIEYDDHCWIGQRMYGRGALMRRVDGGKGALCQFLPSTPDAVADVVRRLERFWDWARYFNIRTKIPCLIDVVKHGRAPTWIY